MIKAFGITPTSKKVPRPVDASQLKTGELESDELIRRSQKTECPRRPPYKCSKRVFFEFKDLKPLASKPNAADRTMTAAWFDTLATVRNTPPYL